MNWIQYTPQKQGAILVLSLQLGETAREETAIHKSDCKICRMVVSFYYNAG